MEKNELVQAVYEMGTAYRKSQILFTALEGGVFELLREPHTVSEAAERLGWSGRGTRILFDALLAIGLVTRSDEAYSNSAAANACLVEGSPAYQGNILRHHHGSYEPYARLTEAVRQGTSPLDGEHRRSGDSLRAFILGMKDVGREVAEAIVEIVDLSAYTHVLDAGGGPGTYSTVFLQRCPGMRATLMDRPEVVRIAQEEVTAAGLMDRYDFIAGDLLSTDMGSGYDLVLVSNIIHSYDPETNQRLFRRCWAAMKPGGLLLVNDFFVDNGRTGPPETLLFALHMLLHTTTAGDTYTFADIDAWTAGIGFVNGQALVREPRPRIWVGEKPL